MLILNESDMSKTITYNKVMDKVEDAYRIFQSGNFYMPERPVITHENNTLLYMPCFISGCFGTKCLTLFPENPSKGHPYIDGLMVLNNHKNGKTKAILDAGYLTAIRTGAVGGVGIRYFSRKDCKNVGIIGAGPQGFYQAIYAASARNIQNVYLFDPFVQDLDCFVKRLKQSLPDKPIEVHICATVEQLLEESEIIITATPATSPVVPDNEDLLQGKCFVAIGSYKPHMRELPNAIWNLVDCVYTELPFAMEESGDLSQPIHDGLLSEDRVKFVGEWLAEDQRPLPVVGQTTYFKSVGMGLFDLVISQFIYEEAVKLGLGQEVEF
ncbi:MAG: ornithine cyclodeaminase family protein [Defluviitaleaceae bacterium]|nr:ornithine cyclodeaminase family protein [Defluviitaleaceae bacterium]